MQFTDDPYVKEMLRFLMTREVALALMFEAGLSTIKPNLPPGIRQGDPRYTNSYFNMSSGPEVHGPWNEGKMPVTGDEWIYVDDPLKHVIESNGMRIIGQGVPPMEWRKRTN